MERDKAEITEVLFSFCNISTPTTSLHAYPCHTGVNAFSKISISYHETLVGIKLYLYPAALRGVKGKPALAYGKLHSLSSPYGT